MDRNLKVLGQATCSTLVSPTRKTLATNYRSIATDERRDHIHGVTEPDSLF